MKVERVVLPAVPDNGANDVLAVVDDGGALGLDKVGEGQVLVRRSVSNICFAIPPVAAATAPGLPFSGSGGGLHLDRFANGQLTL